MKSITAFCVLLIVIITSCSKIDIQNVVETPNRKPTTPVLSDAQWEPFIGTDPRVIALPDFYSNYYAFSFD